MSTRLATGGRLIDRTKPVRFQWNERYLNGFAGDTLASALLANGRTLVGRSFKYHRPRGIVAAGVEEPNALVNLGQGARFEPNQRATTTELFDGLYARSQNHWPSLEFDLGAVNAALSKFFPAGFYYKTFMAPRAAWKHLFEPVIRQSAGLGAPPEKPDADRYEHFYAHVDVLVIGGGVAGLAAAHVAGAAGARVLLLEQSPHLGGRALTDTPAIDGTPAPDWIAAQAAALGAMENVAVRTRTMGAAVNDHGYVLAWERIADHTPGDGRPRHRLWRIRARRIVTATGAIERPLAFAGNDLPGVMLASAVRDYVALWGVSPGDRTVIVTNNDDAYRTALMLAEAGLDVPAVIDARPQARGPLPEAVRARGIPVLEGRAIAAVKGGRRVTGVTTCLQAGEGAPQQEIACDAVAMSGGWSPVVHLWSHCGGKLTWDADRAQFAPDPDRPPLGHDGTGFVIAAGAASGARDTAAVLADAHAAGRRAASETGHAASDAPAPTAADEPEEPLLPVWSMPQGARSDLRAKAFLDYQNDVKVSDVRLAAQEGYESVEHTKRYTTLGMATDQGKLSNINGLAVLADALNAPGRHHHLPPALHPCHARRARRRGARPALQADAQDPDGRLARSPRRALGTGRRLAAALLLPRSRRADPRRRDPRDPQHPPACRPARRLDPRQDPCEGAGCGEVPRPALYRRDVLAARGQVPLRADVQRERLPLRRRRGRAPDRGQLPLPHHLGRLGPGARLDGGMAPDRMVGPQGLGREPHRTVRPGRRRRPQGPPPA